MKRFYTGKQLSDPPVLAEMERPPPSLKRTAIFIEYIKNTPETPKNETYSRERL